MSDWIHELTAAVAAGDDLTVLQAEAAGLHCQHVAVAGDDELFALFTILGQSEPPSAGSPAEKLLTATLAAAAGNYLQASSRQAVSLSDDLRESCWRLYRHLGQESSARHHLLRVLAAVRGEEELQLLAELVATDPPLDSAGLTLALAPLFQHRDYPPLALFPRLLDAVGNLDVATAVVDLCNYLTREGLVESHPAAAREQQFVDLLQQLLDRLTAIESTPPADEETAARSQKQVAQAVPLVCSLCDALALMRSDAAVAALRRAMGLSHRRVRTEAAGALAHSGDEEGRRALVELAAYPVSRLRAIAYADELNLLDQIDQKWQTAVAQAEAELACWLAEPANFGAPPDAMELLDERTQFWPSYDDPVRCYLFRFSFTLADAEYANVGIVGPLTHAFLADLTELGVDELYAVFAGWQAEHADIQEINAEEFDADHHDLVASQTLRLADSGFIDIRPVKLGLFFGEWQLIAVARRDDELGVLIAGNEQADWFPHRTTSPRPPGPEEIYCLWKGRRLLETFNAAT